MEAFESATKSVHGLVNICINYVVAHLTEKSFVYTHLKPPPGIVWV
jgi:hypothetical protein